MLKFSATNAKLLQEMPPFQQIIRKTIGTANHPQLHSYTQAHKTYVFHYDSFFIHFRFLGGKLYFWFGCCCCRIECELIEIERHNFSCNMKVCVMVRTYDCLLAVVYIISIYFRILCGEKRTPNSILTLTFT